MVRKILFHDRNEPNGKRVFCYLAFDFERHEFLILLGFRSGEQYVEERVAVPTFYERASPEEREKLDETIAILLGAQ